MRSSSGKWMQISPPAYMAQNLAARPRRYQLIHALPPLSLSSYHLRLRVGCAVSERPWQTIQSRVLRTGNQSPACYADKPNFDGEDSWPGERQQELLIVAEVNMSVRLKVEDCAAGKHAAIAAEAVLEVGVVS